MKRILVKTTEEITAKLEADRIEYNENLVFVYNGSELIGIFDIGVVQFIYLTQKTVKKNESDKS